MASASGAAVIVLAVAVLVFFTGARFGAVLCGLGAVGFFGIFFPSVSIRYRGWKVVALGLPTQKIAQPRIDDPCRFADRPGTSPTTVKWYPIGDPG